MKAGWAATSRKWRIDNYPAEVTRKIFAPLLKVTFDLRATPEIIQNGFKATVIFPFKPENINFEKCLKNINVENPFVRVSEGPEQSESVCFFVTLESKIDPVLLDQFKKTGEGEEKMGEESGKALFYLWRESKIEEMVKSTRTEEDGQDPPDRLHAINTYPNLKMFTNNNQGHLGE